MGLFNFSTGNAEADSAVGGIFSSVLDKGVAKLLPAGALTPNAKATVAKPSIQGQPTVAPEATINRSGWAAWSRKPVVWVAAGVVVVLLAWKLLAKRGK